GDSLQGQVQACRGDLQHQGRAGFRIAEDQHLLRPHAEPGSCGIATEVYAGEYENAALLQAGFQAVDRRGHGMSCGEPHDSGNLTVGAHGDGRTLSPLVADVPTLYRYTPAQING